MLARRTLLIGGGTIGATVLAGCLSGSSDGEFTFERVVVSDQDPGEYDSYRDVPEERTHQVEDSVWLLVAVGNLPTDDDGTASLEYTVQIAAPDGSTLDPVIERSEQWDDVEGSDVLSVWEGFATYPEDSTGEYEITVTVEDEFEGEQLRTEETFHLEEGD